MTKSKFKVGDKVKILDGSEIENYIHNWAPGMNNYIGAIKTITGIHFCKSCNGYIYDLENSFYDFDERGLELIEGEPDTIEADTVDTATKTAGYWTKEDDDEEDAQFRATVEERAKCDSFVYSKFMYALIKNGVRPKLVKKSFYDPEVMKAGGVPDFIINLVKAMD